MSRLISILLASVVLACGGLATAADDQQSKDNVTEQSNAEGKPDQHETDGGKPGAARRAPNKMDLLPSQVQKPPLPRMILTTWPTSRSATR
jgi:hypothetical protein